MSVVNNKKFQLVKDFKFDSAHHLKGYLGQCSNVHGHTWTGKVYCEGSSDMLENNMLTDFSVIKSMIATLDHTDLNVMLDTDMPTAELIAAYILENIPYAVRVDLYESPGSKVTVTFW